MAWVTHDFECLDCLYVFEEMYKRSERDELECPECGSQNLKQWLSAPNLDTFSMMSAEQRVHSMKKRSADHTQKQIDKEPERWGEQGLARRSKKIQG
jgi:putative FmdB family regulatory protein